MILDYRNIKSDYQDFILWLIDNPFQGCLIYIGLCILACIIMFPMVILSVGAGYAFTQAFSNTFYGVMTGAICT